MKSSIYFSIRLWKYDRIHLHVIRAGYFEFSHVAGRATTMKFPDSGRMFLWSAKVLLSDALSELVVAAMVGITTFKVSETFFMISIQHACGLFAIAR